MSNHSPEKVFVKVGDKVELVLPHSEVCMYMRVAGKRAYVQLQTPEGRKQPISAQIYMQDGRAFSSPILLGEAGFYTLGKDIYYYPPLTSNPAPWLGEVQKGFLVSFFRNGGPHYLCDVPQSWRLTPVKEDAQVFPTITATVEILTQFILSKAWPGIASEYENITITPK